MNSILHSTLIKAHFDSDNTDYGKCAGKVVPKNDELQLQAVQSIRFPESAELKMLDLGLGTGDTTALALKRFANARVVGIDFSKHMLEAAKENLRKAGLLGRVEIIENDFTKSDLGTGFDAVFSAVAIHNCGHKQKQELFSRIARALKAGGCFVNADFVEFEDEQLNQKAKAAYEAFLRANLSGGEATHWIKHAREEDLPASVEKQIAWLKSAGFSSAECVWAHENTAVVRARK